MLEAKTDNSSDESLFADVDMPKANNRNNPALGRKGSGTRHLIVRAIERGQSAQCTERQLC